MSLEEVPSILELLKQIKNKRDKTILLVEHKMDVLMALSDSIAVLHEGRLIADDTPEAISKNREVQEAYFGGGRSRG
jgi:branched-chain amino acid transport system ATP-binding protein